MIGNEMPVFLVKMQDPSDKIKRLAKARFGTVTKFAKHIKRDYTALLRGLGEKPVNQKLLDACALGLGVPVEWLEDEAMTVDEIMARKVEGQPAPRLLPDYDTATQVDRDNMTDEEIQAWVAQAEAEAALRRSLYLARRAEKGRKPNGANGAASH